MRVNPAGSSDPPKHATARWWDGREMQYGTSKEASQTRKNRLREGNGKSWRGEQKNARGSGAREGGSSQQGARQRGGAARVGGNETVSLVPSESLGLVVLPRPATRRTLPQPQSHYISPIPCQIKSEILPIRMPGATRTISIKRTEKVVAEGSGVYSETHGDGSQWGSRGRQITDWGGKRGPETRRPRSGLPKGRSWPK